MKKKVISLITTVGLVMTIGAVGTTSAQANVTQLAPTSFSPLTTVKPNFVPPVDGGGSTTPSIGQQVCSVITYISGYTGIWQKVANLNKWVEVAIYSSAIICSVIYR
jgi:hypothetical protein